jgi:GNAT superfamily N-acetyltransferase
MAMSIKPASAKSVYPTGNAFRRAVLTLRGEGARSFWFKLLAQVGYRRLMLLEWHLDRPVQEFSPSLAVEVAQLAETELDEYLEFRPDTARGDASARLQAGQMCFVARHDRLIVAADWITLVPIRLSYLGCPLDMSPGDVHIYDKVTLPAYRGHGISNALRVHHLRYLQRAGYRRAVVAVLPENASSLRDILKGGYRPCGMIGRIKLGRWQWHFRKASTIRTASTSKS